MCPFNPLKIPVLSLLLTIALGGCSVHQKEGGSTGAVSDASASSPSGRILTSLAVFDFATYVPHLVYKVIENYTTGVDYYRVEVRDIGAESFRFLYFSTDSILFDIDHAFHPGTRYEYRVVPVLNGVRGTPSNIVTREPRILHEIIPNVTLEHYFPSSNPSSTGYLVAKVQVNGETYPFTEVVISDSTRREVASIPVSRTQVYTRTIPNIAQDSFTNYFFEYRGPYERAYARQVGGHAGYQSTVVTLNPVLGTLSWTPFRNDLGGVIETRCPPHSTFHIFAKTRAGVTRLVDPALRGLSGCQIRVSAHGPGTVHYAGNPESRTNWLSPAYPADRAFYDVTGYLAQDSALRSWNSSGLSYEQLYAHFRTGMDGSQTDSAFFDATGYLPAGGLGDYWKNQRLTYQESLAIFSRHLDGSQIARAYLFRLNRYPTASELARWTGRTYREILASL